MSFAILSGICASVASLCGKLPAYADRQHLIPSWIVIAGCSLCVIGLNGLMWTNFVKALQERGGSLIATVVSCATNYIFSAVLGCFIFGETTSLFWWAGTGLIILGLIIITREEVNCNKEETRIVQ